MSIPISAVFQDHYQYEGDFCAASAHEFIMKLHGKLGLDKFPLQSLPTNEGKGFSFSAFLQAYEFAQDVSESTTAEDTIAILKHEVDVGRYPLLTVYRPSTPWHIIVAVKEGNEVHLADPKAKRFISDSTFETSKEIQKTITQGGRPFLHMLTYS